MNVGSAFLGPKGQRPPAKWFGAGEQESQGWRSAALANPDHVMRGEACGAQGGHVRPRPNRPRRLNPPKTHHDGLQARRTSVLRTASRRPALCIWWSTRSIPGPATAGLLPARASPDGIPATRLPSSTARLPSSARLSSPAGRLSSSAGLSSSARWSSPRILPSSAGWRFEIRRPHDWSAGRSGMLLLSGLPLLDAEYIETGGW
ncbi:hypothetical protein BKA56DRAFT_152309 [Ilyonectria sp. MPI-CAGE-AT-0026]|nr:hypothetical protein BKA56DRAFT_152309 [Ilyonectria sp. MPI-CAGE-AT-0026]